MHKTEFLLWDGKICEDKDIIDESVVAKTVYSDDSKNYTCYIKSAKGFLYNPNSTRHNVSNSRLPIRWKWREVSKQTLELYTMFIKTKNEAYYKQAERSKLD